MAPKKPLFRIVVDHDMDNSIPIIAEEDFPDELGEYRESIFVQMMGRDYYTSQLVLKQGDGLLTYDFYSDRAWFDEVKRQAVEPYKEREREEERATEREQWKQEGAREGREAKGAEYSFIYHIVDRETTQPVYVGRSVNVGKRVQQHLNSSRALSGIPKLYGYLGRLLEEEHAFPTVRVVGKTPRRMPTKKNKRRFSDSLERVCPYSTKSM